MVVALPNAQKQSGFGAVMQLPLLLLGPNFRWRAAAPAPTAELCDTQHCTAA